jgi:hypothetical protein
VSYATANGIRVLDATVHMPRVGVWHADVEIDAEDVAQLGQKVALVVGEQRFHGATMRAFARLERVVARLRGGAGKLHEEVPPRAYRDVPRAPSWGSSSRRRARSWRPPRTIES